MKKELKRKIYNIELFGQPLSLEISELASKANSAVLGRYGDTVVLVAVVMSEREAETDYFPLTVDYEERFYAAGKIMGSRFIRREGRPSDEAILSARLVDRAIRPLFNHNLKREVQITITVLAYDEKNDPDIIALLATSTALGISDIPWDGPVAGVKLENAFFAGTEDLINMIEFEGEEVLEKDLVNLFEVAQKEIKKLVDFQKLIIQELGREKINIEVSDINPEIKNLIENFVKDKLGEAIRNKTLNDLKNSLFKYLAENFKEEKTLKIANSFFDELVDNYLHSQILEKEQRPDGRKLDEIRSLYAEVGLFKRTHGSALFIRGETQILAVTTLAPPSAEQLVETVEFSGHKRFLLHYNFPSFSSGEIGRLKTPGRREIGHGALAAKALNALIPSKDEFPYTIRVVAETLSSNGSTSMASVCAASLALMDAGVPIKKHVAGIAIGLILDQNDKTYKTYKLLTDIQGPEDHHGDMDFKVAGTVDGVTAIQMDVKIKGITIDIFKEALERAKKARLEILDFMNTVLDTPRKSISPYAPTVFSLTIPKEKIGELIGPGGRNINNIIAASLNQVTIDIESDGKVYVSGLNNELVERAYKAIKESMKEFQIGEVVEGKVIKLFDFGAIVDLGSGKDGMIHISELKNGYVRKIEEVVKVGDIVKAKIIKIDPVDGRISLSMKALDNNGL